VRLAGALLALAVSAVHVADQGAVTALASPDWIGWGYRLIEVGGVLTAIALLLAPMAPPPARSARPVWSALPHRLGWAAGVLLGAGPFLAYIVSRTVGMPGDPRDVGNWRHWAGTVSLLTEASLVTLSVSMLVSLRHSDRQHVAHAGRRHHAEVTHLPGRSGRKAGGSCGPAAPRSHSSTSPSPQCLARPARRAPARPHCRSLSRGRSPRPDALVLAVLGPAFAEVFLAYGATGCHLRRCRLGHGRRSAGARTARRAADRRGREQWRAAPVRALRQGIRSGRANRAGQDGPNPHVTAAAGAGSRWRQALLR
jgi:hypothetical protein